MHTIVDALPSDSLARPVLIAQKLGAEAVGTFALVFTGCGAVMVDRISEGRVTHLGVGLTFGLIIMVMIYAVGHISGAHFNPAVTLAFASLGRFPWPQVPLYVATQVASATFAALLLRSTLGPVAGIGRTTPAGSAAQSLVMEAVITFLLMFVITAVATDARAVGAMAGWAIGGTVALAALFAGPISGASMNPARSLGPAIASGSLDAIWIYLLGPAFGAVAGAWAYRTIRCGGEERPAGGCC